MYRGWAWSCLVPKRPLTGERTALLLAATTRVCYRPECEEPLVAIRDGHRISNFEFAHIRDERPPRISSSNVGWRYWPDDLTQAERNRFDNLLLLCPPCHKLIDRIQPRDFSPELLHEWKRAAEGDAFDGLTTEPLDVQALATFLSNALRALPRLELSLPTLAERDGLSFASRSVSLAGRTQEGLALSEFLASETVFSWWTIIGEAGVGKSRLALECCLGLDGAWDVGFVRDADQEALLEVVPDRPTLLVVDYAAARAEWLGSLLLNLARRKEANWEPVRVLVVDRTVHAKWYEVATCQSRHHDSLRIMSDRYAEPLVLGGLSRNATRRLIADFVSGPDGPPNSTLLEYLVDRAFALDPAGRPLFSLVAALEYSDPQSSGGSRDSVLRGIIQRRQAQATGETLLAILVLEVAATALGGIDVQSYPDLESLGAEPFTLPALSDLSTEVNDRGLSGMVPDILGEMWILDKLDSGGVQAQACQAALELAWRYSPARYAAFVDRTARDHPNHGQLLSLLSVDSSVEIRTWFEMVCSVIPYLGDPRSPRVYQVLDLIDAQPSDESQETALAEAGYAVANLWFSHRVLDMAHTLYTKLIETAPRDSEVRWNSYTNRGVAELLRNNPVQGEADFEAVITSSEASDEARASCLNNRADLRAKEGDHVSAIRDRSAVLELRETSYNRRFIALARRASSLWALGRLDEADHDIESILSTTDIAVEQKMSARLMRAEWAAGLGVPEMAEEELDQILNSRRNFPKVADAADALAHDLGMSSSSAVVADEIDSELGHPISTSRSARQRYLSRLRQPF